MPHPSRLARLQQATTFLLISAVLAWTAWHWPQRPGLAVAGALVIAFGYALFLGAEFLVLHRIARHDTTPTPTAGELLAAWWAEVRVAPAVFCWRQPFRWRCEPDQDQGQPGRRGIVFIHGFVCNRGLWAPWLREARRRGHAYTAVNLEPVFGSIDDYAPILEGAVERMRRATGMPPVLVCHSMGGLAARAWLRLPGRAQRVAHVVTLGTPHAGTWLARFSHVTNGIQMRQGGEWLRQLAQDEAARAPVPFTCWYTNCDNIVFPTSTATLPGADNHLVRGAAHVDLAFRPEVMRGVLDQVGGL